MPTDATYFRRKLPANWERTKPGLNYCLGLSKHAAERLQQRKIAVDQVYLLLVASDLQLQSGNCRRVKASRRTLKRLRANGMPEKALRLMSTLRVVVSIPDRIIVTAYRQREYRRAIA